MANKEILVIRDKVQYFGKITVYLDSETHCGIIDYTRIYKDTNVYYNSNFYSDSDTDPDRSKCIFLDTSKNTWTCNSEQYKVDINGRNLVSFQMDNPEFIPYGSNTIDKIRMFFDNLAYDIKFCWGLL